MCSSDLDAASARSLGLQFMLFFVDVTGQSLLDESLNFDPTALRRSGWYGSLGVSAVGPQGLEYAYFLFSVDRIQAGAAGPGAVPEPTSGALVAAAMAALLLAVRRSTCVSRIATHPNRS